MARTFTTTERTTVAAARNNHYATLEITDPDGAWRDVSTSLSTPDWFNEATLTESIDSNTVAFSATLLRDAGTLALAPLRTDSTVNRNGVGAYAPMLDVKRKWRMKVAVTDPGTSPTMKEMASGYIDRIDVQDPAPTITVTGRGMEAPLLDGYISVVRTYCSSGPLPVETVIQQMIDDTLGTGADLSLGGLSTPYSSGITLYTPTYSPTYYINQGYRPAVGNLMDALTKLAQLAGMVLRYRYDASDVNRLTLATVNRNPTVTDWSIGPTEYTSIPVNALDLSGVRTYIDLYYVDASLGQQHVTSPSAGTSDAITLYGKRYMRVDVAGSVTLTSTNAQQMADAMRSDLELPALEQQLVAPGLWFAQLYDYVGTAANGVQYDQDQAGGITQITQHLSGGTITTTLSLRGKPAGRYRTWLRYATQPISSLVYNQCIAQVTATSATTITVTVTASAPSGTPTVTLSAITGTATLNSGPALGTASTSGTVWVFNRGAALGGSGAVQFTADFGGNVSDTDLVVIPEQGRDTTYLFSRARVIASNGTSVTVRYAVADPYPQGSNSVTITYQAQGVGTVSPASGQTVTPNATITENAGTYVDFTIQRPVFGTGTGRVTFTATAAGRVSDSDAVDVPAGDALPIPKLTTNQTSRTQSAVTLSLSCNNLPGTYTWFVKKATYATNGNVFYDDTPTGAIASGSNSSTPLPTTVSVTAPTGQDDLYVLVVQTAGVGLGGYTSTAVVQATLPALDSTGGGVVGTATVAGISAGLIAQAQGTGVWTENWESGALSSWATVNGSSATVLAVSAGSSYASYGKNALQLQGNGTWLASTRNIPFDPTKLYRIRFRLTVTSYGGGGAPVCYAGVAGVAGDGTTLLSAASGANSYSSSFYAALNGTTISFNSGVMLSYDGWVKGINASTGTIPNGVGTPTAPRALYQGTKYLRPLLVFNSGGTSSTCECYIDSVEITEYDDDASARVYTLADPNGRVTQLQLVPMGKMGGLGWSLNGVDWLAPTTWSGTLWSANINAVTVTIGGKTITYTGGAVTSAADSTTYYIYNDDPNYTGTFVPQGLGPGGGGLAVLAAAEGRQYIGSFTTGTHSGTTQTSPPPAPVQGGPTCFPAGTMVTLANGEYAPIESITPGTLVRAFDPESKRHVTGKVAGVLTHDDAERDVLTLATAHGTLVTTPEHRIFTDRDGGSFVEASELAQGDTLYLESGTMQSRDLRPVRLDAITPSTHSGPVYNLAVELWQTYFADGVAVHNVKPV